MPEHDDARSIDSRDPYASDSEVRASHLGDRATRGRQLADMPSTRPSGAGRRSTRGFASMDPQRQKEIASKGGRAAHRKGTAHQWSVEEARVAGRKGGTSVSRDREHMAAIGREGGASAHRRARQEGEAQESQPRR